ncbi:MAG TPA: hypothetical protein VMD91_05380 [Candidatus Sulfotelmatobacter sp.]|nr:hypothetical protein [Candidatus Sulfotelmatobacter sp.]
MEPIAEHVHTHADGTTHRHPHDRTDPDHRPRRGKMGPTRSTRLPAELDAWLESRLLVHRDRSVSEILLELIHGGLRLREGYMAVHRRVLEDLAAGEPARYQTYRGCLLDTFGPAYVAHLDRWLEADGVVARSAATTP